MSLVPGKGTRRGADYIRQLRELSSDGLAQRESDRRVARQRERIDRIRAEGPPRARSLEWLEAVT